MIRGVYPIKGERIETMNDNDVNEFRVFRSEQLATMQDALSHELLDLEAPGAGPMDGVFFSEDNGSGAGVFKLNGFRGVRLTVYNIRPHLIVNGRRFTGCRLFRMLDAIMQADFDCAADKECAELDIPSPVIWMARA